MGGEQRQGGTEAPGVGGTEAQRDPGGSRNPEQGYRSREKGEQTEIQRGVGSETQREGKQGLREKGTGTRWKNRDPERGWDRDEGGQRQGGGEETQREGRYRDPREGDRDTERDGGPEIQRGGQRPRERRPEVWGWGVERAQRKRAKGGVGTETWKAKTQREKWGQRPRDGRG